MAETTTTRRGPKPTLSREAVIEAALELIDADGLPALNMRTLASRLGVSAMTPYSYFADKAELLDSMVGHALSSLALDPRSEQPWDERLEQAMRGMHDALELHPSVIDLIVAGTPPARLDEFRADMLAMLSDAGLSRDQSADALRTLTAYVLGLSVLTRLRGDPAGARRRQESFARGLDRLMDDIRSQRSQG